MTNIINPDIQLLVTFLPAITCVFTVLELSSIINPQCACARELQWSSCLSIGRSVDLATSDLSDRFILNLE